MQFQSRKWLQWNYFHILLLLADGWFHGFQIAKVNVISFNYYYSFWYQQIQQERKLLVANVMMSNKWSNSAKETLFEYWNNKLRVYKSLWMNKYLNIKGGGKVHDKVGKRGERLSV